MLPSIDIPPYTTKDEIIPGLYAAGEVIGSREYRLTGAYGGGLGTGYSTGWIAAQTIAEELAAN